MKNYVFVLYVVAATSQAMDHSLDTLLAIKNMLPQDEFVKIVNTKFDRKPTSDEYTRCVRSTMEEFKRQQADRAAKNQSNIDSAQEKGKPRKFFKSSTNIKIQQEA